MNERAVLCGYAIECLLASKWRCERAIRTPRLRQPVTTGQIYRDQQIHITANTPLDLNAITEGSSDHDNESLQQLVLAWLRALIELGAEREKVVLLHADQWCHGGLDGPNFRFLLSVLELGASVVFDMIGLSTVSDVMPVDAHHQETRGLYGAEPPRDSTIAAWVGRLVLRHDRARQILLSTNVHQQLQYRRHGGGGYAFLFSFFKPRLLALGVTQQQWTQLVCGNPVALLSWYSPPAAAEVPRHFLTCSICREPFEPVEGEYFTKFAFTYCGTRCLRRHSRLQFVDPPPSPKRKDL